jgi:hypothetical protein
MNKSVLVTAITITFMMLLSTNVRSQKFSELDKSPMDIASYPSIHDDSNTRIKIVYSRPQLKGRSLSKLIPNDKIWRTGANEATEITFYNDVKFGGKAVKQGTYSLATIPGEEEWIIILNSAVNAWGAYSYKESNDIARVKVPVSHKEKALEAFSISFQKTDKGVNMFLAWDTLRIVVPIDN